ncbi:MAG: flagellar export protein FliJ [bacterium]
MVFEFRLERVLRYREEEERQALVFLAKTQLQREMVQRGLLVLQRELEEVREVFNNMKGSQVDGQQLSMLSRRWRWLRLEKEKQSRLLDQWNEKVEKAQEHWLEVRAAKEALMKLRQKAFREFLGNLQRAETRELDEVGLRIFWLEGGVKEGSTQAS